MSPVAPARARPALLAAAALVAAAVLASPSGAATSGARPPRGPHPVIEEDFHITAPDVVRAGRVDLEVTNAGPDDHELLVVRRSEAELPMRKDGLTVDERAIRRRLAGGIDATKPGSVRTLRLKLKPGRYELFCNMSGHYLGGMEATFEAVR